MSFEILPHELITRVLAELPLRARCRALAVSRIVCDVGNQPELWRECMLGSCEDEHLDDAALLTILRRSAGGLTHLEALNAPFITAAGLAPAFEQHNTLQFFDIRGCASISVRELLVPLGQILDRFDRIARPGLHPDPNDCTIRLSGACFESSEAGLIELSRKHCILKCNDPPCKDCEQRRPCKACIGIDFVECQLCESFTAPWFECADSGCEETHLCGECALPLCSKCEKRWCEDHEDHEDHKDHFFCCDLCELSTCPSCTLFPAGCTQCGMSACNDCIIKRATDFTFCIHCCESACRDCSQKDGRYYEICGQCYNISCNNCASKDGRYTVFCNTCSKQTCSDCVGDGKLDSCCIASMGL